MFAKAWEYFYKAWFALGLFYMFDGNLGFIFTYFMITFAIVFAYADITKVQVRMNWKKLRLEEI